MSPGSSTESYPAFARIGLRENPGKNLNQVTCSTGVDMYVCEMSPGSSTENYPVFARIGLRENPGKNLNQVTCSTGVDMYVLPRKCKPEEIRKESNLLCERWELLVSSMGEEKETAALMRAMRVVYLQLFQHEGLWSEDRALSWTPTSVAQHIAAVVVVATVLHTGSSLDIAQSSSSSSSSSSIKKIAMAAEQLVSRAPSSSCSAISAVDTFSYPEIAFGDSSRIPGDRHGKPQVQSLSGLLSQDVLESVVGA
ncbi:hypothetical protein ANN_15113 [Periplaneta americana]|uniref:Uncharacterized protein n=1 Tax=Periplaneta americana TaxID=6978 RepID=A0ABQ8SZL2_PERAM|nr:hypothetical protein ANN_15113 [Periplaneta americana]